MNLDRHGLTGNQLHSPQSRGEIGLVKRKRMLWGSSRGRISVNRGEQEDTKKVIMDAGPLTPSGLSVIHF